MCSSRGRPQKLNEMIDSVYLNRSEGTELVVYVSEQDRELAEYRPVLERVPHIIGPHRNMVQILNYLSMEVYPNMSYYTDLNDDQYVMTPHWDSIMIKAIEEHGGWSMASVESPNHLPYATVYPGKMVRTLGYYFPPKFRHVFVDNVQLAFKHVDFLFYVEGIRVDHRHVAFGTAVPDETFVATAGKQSEFDYGLYCFNEWSMHQRDADMLKLLRAQSAEREANAKSNY